MDGGEQSHAAPGDGGGDGHRRPRVAPRDAGAALAAGIIDLLRAVGMPNGLSAIGYTPDDVDRLVEVRCHNIGLRSSHLGRSARRRLRQLFLESMTLWK